MQVKLHQLGKRYRFDWIYRQLDAEFPPGSRVAITGPNGSGKSTLLRSICGYLTPTEGQVEYLRSGRSVDRDEVYRSVAYAAPYVELIEEFTLRELLDFQRQFFHFEGNRSTDELIERMELKRAGKKEIRFFSSGMKQRLKLALAICSTRPLLILDEPTTNLDAAGAAWYLDLIEEFGGEKTIFVASNVEGDFAFCDRHLSILDHKPKRRKRRGLLKNE